MKYTAKRFSVPASSDKSPPDCKHQWVDEKRGRCVLCGESVGVWATACTTDSDIDWTIQTR